MGLLKHTLFTIIPIATLLIAIAYGIEVIFGINLTYLGWTSPTGDYYKNIYDFKSYLQALSFDNVAKPFENLGNAIGIILKPVNTIIKVWSDGYNLGDIVATIVNIFITLIDALIWIIDLLISLIQVLTLIIAKFFNLFGVNTKADFGIFNIFRAFTNWTLIPGLNGVSF